MNRKYLISFVAGLSFVALVGATFKSLMLDESGNCSQSVNFTGTTTLNSAAIATQAYSDGLVTAHNSDGSAHSSAFAAKLAAANNLSDVSSASTARSNLGLKSAALLDAGTSAGNVVQLDGSAKLPAVDGSALTNLPASGESNTASNLGTGTGVFAQKSSVDLQFKSLVAGTNIEITNDSTGITIAATGSASGEANTASNIGVGGVGVFAQKSGVDLQFKNIIAGSNKVLVSDDTADSEIAVDVQPGNIAHQDLSGAGTNTHSQIDSHISSTSNPHSVTAAQVGAISTAGTAEINALTEKTTPADNDEIVIEDSADSYAKKKVKISNLPAGGSGSTSDTSRGDGTWTSTTSSPSQRAIEESITDVGVKYSERASSSSSDDNGRLVKRYVGSGGIDGTVSLCVHFDESDAAWTDSSLSAHTLTNYSATYNASGKFDGCGVFAGAEKITSSVDSGYLFGTDNWTIETFFKTTTTTAEGIIISQRATDFTGAWSLRSSNFFWYDGSSTQNLYHSQTYTDGNWHHMAVVKNGTTLTLYFDGVSRASATVSAALSFGSSTSDVVIGYEGAANKYFTGSVDEIRISNGTARYTSGFTPATSAFSSAVLDNRLSSVKDSDINFGICQGRLTLESGVPVSTTDQTAKTTLYFTPNITGQNCGNKIALYNGSSWSVLTFTEASLSLSGLSANTIYDIYGYDYNGTLTLSAATWTDATTRATALYLQDGIYVKTGATNYRYLGTIRTTATTGQCEDSVSNRFVWNMYNRVPRKMYVAPGYSDNDANATASVSNTTWSEFVAGGSAGAGTVSFVVGLAEDMVSSRAHAIISNPSSVDSKLGIGYDTTTTAKTLAYANINLTSSLSTEYIVIPSIGTHSISILCVASGSSSTWYCDFSRIGGTADPASTYLNATINN